jgi:DNA-binding IscR family transcriptional regulator
VAQEGPLFLNECLTDGDSCERKVFCPVHGAWATVRNDMMATLKNYTFAQLVQMEKTNIEKLGK